MDSPAERDVGVVAHYEVDFLSRYLTQEFTVAEILSKFPLPDSSSKVASGYLTKLVTIRSDYCSLMQLLQLSHYLFFGSNFGT